MAKRIFVFFLSILITFTINISPVANKERGEITGNMFANAITKITNNQPVRVAFLGDSICYGFYTTGYVTWPTTPENAPNSYYTQFRNYLEGKNSGSETYNPSVPGWTSDAHISNKTPEYCVNNNYDLAFISLGINESWRYQWSKARYKTAIETMVNTLLNGNVAVVLCKENAFISSTDANNVRLGTEYAEAIDELATQYELKTIDFWTPFDDKLKINDYSLMFSSVDVHPSQAGHNLYFSTLKDFVDNTPITSTQPEHVSPFRRLLRAGSPFNPYH
jgi:lysophospholipase L1-like esterase